MLLRDVVAASPTLPDLKNLGLVLNSLERPTEALRMFERAWEIDADDAAIRSLLLGTAGTVARLHRSTPDAAEEVSALRTIARLAPDDATNHAWLGRALQRAGCVLRTSQPVNFAWLHPLPAAATAGTHIHTSIETRRHTLTTRLASTGVIIPPRR